MRAAREVDPEATPIAGLGFEAQPSTHSLYCDLCHRKPHPGAREQALIIEAFESPEDPLVVLRIDPDPIVFNPEAHHLLMVIVPDPHGRPGARRCEFDSI